MGFINVFKRYIKGGYFQKEVEREIMESSNKNEVEAVKVAKKIIDILNEHNKKFREKIDFGIGITSGEIINRIENKKLKFTA